jgi:hypothetical protein
MNFNRRMLANQRVFEESAKWNPMGWDERAMMR